VFLAIPKELHSVALRGKGTSVK